MPDTSINIVAVIVAALAKFVQGWIWFSPLMFLGPWRDAVQISDERMREGLGVAMGIWLAATLTMALVLAYGIRITGATGAAQGMLVAGVAWLGFVLVPLIDDYAAEKRPFSLLAIKAGNQLVGLLLMGAILGVWR